jgi:uridine kinase
LVEALIEVIASRRTRRPLLVAVDGPDAAGKTTLADELAEHLRGRREEVIRVGIDGFHRPRTVRLRRGSLSPEGYYHDSFDYDAVRRVVLGPLGPGGDRRYRTGVFDYRTDQRVSLFHPQAA